MQDRACQRRCFGWKRWSKEWLYRTRGLFSEHRVCWSVDLGSRSGLIGLINFDVKCAGARSAGNPAATFDVAGARNPLTVRILRHFQRKRGAMDKPDLRSTGASPRPYQHLRCSLVAGNLLGIPLCLQRQSAEFVQNFSGEIYLASN
jgi:hypothetical protein